MQNNATVREMLGTRGIKAEELPPSEDIMDIMGYCTICTDVEKEIPNETENNNKCV